MNSVIFPGYTIGEDAYDKVKEICPLYGRTVAAVGGKTAMSKAREAIDRAAAAAGLAVADYIWYGGEASEENVQRLVAMPSVQQADMLFAIGGGKAIDTCKLLAHLLKKPFFTFPTIISNCASLTSLSVVYKPSGEFSHLAFSKIPPVHAFINTKIAAAAPKQFLWAGMGDTIAKFYEANLSARGAAMRHSDALGVTISSMCAEPILKYGAAALADNEKGLVSPAFEETALAVIVSTGMVSNFVVQDFNGHIAHALFCALTMLPQIEAHHLHGEIVMYGVLVLLMCDGQLDELARNFAFCKKVGLPTKLSDIDVTLAEMEPVLAKTVESSELKVSPYPVTQEMLLKAVMDLEEYNQKMANGGRA